MKEKWNVLTLTGLILLSFIISPVGIVLGSLNLKQTERKKQAYIILIIGIIMTLMWIYHFAGHQHHH